MKIFLALSLIGMASAACPNSCSGHGTCGSNEVCECYDGWGYGGQEGGDCSDRFCPYEIAWAANPNKAGSQHIYKECAGKGICDRETGQCECFGGFEGKACGRQTCPDDCSGHGTCKYMDELSFGTVFGDYYDGSATTYQNLGSGAVNLASTQYSWDAHRARACVCDATWTGVNCASRMCPSGNDVMDLRSNTANTVKSQIQTITLISGGSDAGSASGSGDVATDFDSLSFSLSFTSKMNETFTTSPIAMVSGNTGNLATDVKNALEALPNRVIDTCLVTAVTSQTGNTDYDPALKIQVTFTGTSVYGQQHLLEVNTNSCGEGCTPLQDGITSKLRSVSNSSDTLYGVLSSVAETQASDYNSFECGRRGKCDYDQGLCSCFDGYTGEACTFLTALV